MQNLFPEAQESSREKKALGKGQVLFLLLTIKWLAVRLCVSVSK